jgi:hypothetical protein
VTVVKINAITVPRERFDEFTDKFASRAAKVEESAERLARSLHPTRTSLSRSRRRPPTATADDRFHLCRLRPTLSGSVQALRDADNSGDLFGAGSLAGSAKD